MQQKTVRIGTRGSPLALAQAYMTRDKLKVGRAWGGWTVVGVVAAGATAHGVAGWRGGAHWG